MAAQVIPLLSRIRAPVSRDWSQREIAEFYRVESALVQAGIELESERGLTDEGDPWFCFCRADTGEVFIHFARVDGRYVVDGGPFGAAARGDDFSELVRELIARHPLAASRRSGSNVFMHPAALLIALVGACFFHSGQAKAAETAEAHAARLAAADGHRRQGLALAAGQAPPAGAEPATAFTVTLDAAQTAAILTGVLIGLRDAGAAARGAASAADPAATLFVAPRAAEIDPAHLASAISTPDSRAVLAVVAVLHDLFRLQSAAARPIELTPDPTGVGAAIAAALPGPSTTEAGAAGPPPAVTASAAPAIVERPVVVVHLTAAALPHVEAVAILEATGVLKLIGDDHLDALDRLPAYLADAIAHGEHVQVVTDDGSLAAPSLADPSTTLPSGHATVAADGLSHETGGAGAHETPPPTDTAPADSPPPTVAHDPPPSAPAPPPADPAPPAPLLVAPTPPAPTPSPPPATPAPPPAADQPDVVMHGHSAVFDAAVLKFTADVHAGILVSGSEVILYDPQVLQPLAPGQHLDSITFHFDDGSSISLVGTTTSLHDLHGLS